MLLPYPPLPQPAGCSTASHVDTTCSSSDPRATRETLAVVGGADPVGSEFSEGLGRARDLGRDEGRARELAGAQVLLAELTVALVDGAVGEEEVRAEAREMADVVEVHQQGHE
jgi:hypothetical protein